MVPLIYLFIRFQEEGSKFCTLPRQRKSQSYSIKNVSFEKGPGKKSLGFTVVGGKDSPKGSIGIYVKSIFANGQAVGLLKEGEHWSKICYTKTSDDCLLRLDKTRIKAIIED